MTANAFDEDRSAACGGMNDFIAKPVGAGHPVRNLARWLGPAAQPVRTPPSGQPERPDRPGVSILQDAGVVGFRKPAGPRAPGWRGRIFVTLRGASKASRQRAATPPGARRPANARRRSGPAAPIALATACSVGHADASACRPAPPASPRRARCRHPGQAVAHAVRAAAQRITARPLGSISPASSSCSGRSTAMLSGSGLQGAGRGHRHRRTVASGWRAACRPEAPPCPAASNRPTMCSPPLNPAAAGAGRRGRARADHRRRSSPRSSRPGSTPRSPAACGCRWAGRWGRGAADLAPDRSKYSSRRARRSRVVGPRPSAPT